MADPPAAPQPFRVEVLEQHHDRASFACGAEPLDRYFETQVNQDIRRRIARCMVAIETSSGVVAGYYTLSATSLALADLPGHLAKGLPRYPVAPAVVMRRLAVSSNMQGRKLGRALLAHALEYVAAIQIGAFAMVVDAKDDAAQRFYERHGFVGIKGHSRRLILPVATALQTIGRDR